MYSLKMVIVQAPDYASLQLLKRALSRNFWSPLKKAKVVFTQSKFNEDAVSLLKIKLLL